LYPSTEILKIFCKKNIPVTINADAHSPRELDGNYNTAFNALIEAGYKEYYILKDKKRGSAMWEAEPLRKDV